MKLKDWLEKYGVKATAFGKSLDVSEFVVYNWCKGRSLPNLDQVIQIWKKTNGEVTIKDFTECKEVKDKQ